MTAAIDTLARIAAVSTPPVRCRCGAPLSYLRKARRCRPCHAAEMRAWRAKKAQRSMSAIICGFLAEAM
jgi:hypothetical protein